MGRKLAVVGVPLVAVAVLLGALSQSLVQSASVPGQASFAVVQLVVSLLSAVLMTVGVVLIALAVLASVMGRPPLPGHPPQLVWWGAALILLSVAFQVGGGWFLGGMDTPWFSFIPLEVAWFFRGLGSTLVGVWLAGRLADAPATRTPQSQGTPG